MDLPSVKAPRQPEWCVSFYAVAEDPTDGVHGVYGVVGLYDSKEKAIEEGKQSHAMLNSMGITARMTLSRTGDVQFLTTKYLGTAEQDNAIKQLMERKEKARREMEVRLTSKHTPPEDKKTALQFMRAIRESHLTAAKTLEESIAKYAASVESLELGPDASLLTVPPKLPE